MSNMPIKKFRAANFEAAIWNNSKKINGNEVAFKTVSLSRSYKKKDEEVWRNEVINMRRSDIPKALVVLNETLRELMLNPEAGDEDD